MIIVGKFRTTRLSEETRNLRSVQSNLGFNFSL